MDWKKAIILLIEDDTLLSSMYAIKFKLSGLKLIIAQNGRAGLTQAIEKKPDLILLDIKMEDIDGFEILKRLKADSTTKNIPVILFTNMGEKENAEKGLALGADQYILKAKTLPSEIVDKVIKRLKKI